MKKYVAILLALLMLCMFGCTTTVETGETTAETTDTVPVLLTAEDYFLKAFEVDVARSMEMAETYKSARMSLGVKNVDYLLSLFAMNNAGLPAISDVALEIAADSEKLDAMYLLSAMINGHDANIGLNINMTDFDMAVFSNLFEDVIGIDYSEMVGMEMPDMSSLYDFSYNATEKYVMLIGELLMEHNTGVELTDNGDTVTVSVGLDGEKMFDFAAALLDELANDEQFVKLMSDFYQVDFEEVMAAFHEDAADTKQELVDSGVKMNMDVEIDKETFDTYHANVEITDGTDTFVIFAEETEGAASFILNSNDEVIFDLGYESADDFFNADFSLEVAEEDGKCSGYIKAEGGNFDIAIDVTATEYDWETGKEVAVEHMLSLNGIYTVEGDKYTVTIGSISYNEITIDLSKAGITLSYELGVEVVEIPAVTKNFLDITDEEGQALIMGIFEKLEIDPAMFGIGAAVPETEMDYDAYYEESYEVQ